MTTRMLTNQYWADNIYNTVLFAGALAQARLQKGEFDLALEIGPHPALKGPTTTTLDSFRPGKCTPYTALLSRGQSDIEQVSAALGFVWTRLGVRSVAFSAVQTVLSGHERKTVVSDLPGYPFNHQRSYWTSSRIANHFKHRSALHVTNPVLGNPSYEATTTDIFQWRRILQPTECPGSKATCFGADGLSSHGVREHDD